MDKEKRTIEDAINDLVWMAREDAKRLEEEIKGAVSIDLDKLEERNRINLAKIIDSATDTEEIEENKKFDLDIIIESNEVEKNI